MSIDYRQNYISKAIEQTPIPAINIPEEFEKKLGSGLDTKFPYDRGKYGLRSGSSKVKQNIYMIMMTPVGRRMDQPDWGSMIYKLIHESKTERLKDELELATFEALKAWCPAIICEQVDIDYTPQNAVVIIIQFVIKGTLSRETVGIKLEMGDNQIFNASMFTYNGTPFFG